MAVAFFRFYAELNDFLSIQKKEVSKEAIVDQLPESIRLYVNEFYQCQNCNQVYWKGSHYEKLQQFIQQLTTNYDTNLSP